MEDNLPKECSILGCKRNAELYCNCKQLPDYICNDHKQHHLNTGTTHKLIQAYIEVDNHKINSFVEILNIEINYFRQSKYAIISKTNEIISFLHQNSSKFIRDIDEILSKRLSEITSLQLSNKVFHSKLDHFNSLTKEPYSVDPGIIDVTHVLNTLKSMFSNILAPVSPFRMPAITLDPLSMSPYASLSLKEELLRRYGIQIRDREPLAHIAISIQACIAVTCEKSSINMKIWDLRNKGEKLEIIVASKNSKISCLAITRNNEYILTGGQTGEIKVWNIETKSVHTELRGHSGRVLILAEAKNEMLATAGWDGSLKLWNLRDFTLAAGVHELHKVKGYGSITCVCITNDDSLVITGGHDGYIKVYEVASSTIVMSYPAHKGTIMCFALTSDGRFLVSGSQDSVIKILNLAMRQPEVTLKGHDRAILKIMISQDDKNFVSLGEDKRIIVFNIGEKRKQAKIKQAEDFKIWKNILPEIDCLKN